MLVVLTGTYCNKVNIQITQRDDFIQKVGKTEWLSPKCTYKIWSVGIVMFCVHRIAADGSSVPKYVGVGINHEMYFMILYFTAFY